MRKTFYLEQDGIRVDGCLNKTAARKAWEDTRDNFAKRAAECGTWVFNYRGHVLIVEALAPCDTWMYRIVRPDTAPGVVGSSCVYGAASQVAAICQALGALVQSLWSRDCDDAELFDGMVKAARIFPAEMTAHRSDFMYLVSRWRESQSAA